MIFVTLFMQYDQGADTVILSNSWIFVFFIPFVVFQGPFWILSNFEIIPAWVLYTISPVSLLVACMLFANSFSFKYKFLDKLRIGFLDYVLISLCFALLLVQNILYSLPISIEDSTLRLPVDKSIGLFYLIIIPVMEEYFFRFLLIDFLCKKRNVMFASLLSVIGFVIIHFNFEFAGYYLLFGLIFVILRLKYQSLSLNIGLHWMHNIIVLNLSAILGLNSLSFLSLKILFFKSYYLAILVALVGLIFMLLIKMTKDVLPKNIIAILLVASISSPIFNYFSTENTLFVGALNNATNVNSFVFYDAEGQLNDYNNKSIFMKMLYVLPSESLFSIVLLSKAEIAREPIIGDNEIVVGNLKANEIFIMYYLYSYSTHQISNDKFENSFFNLLDPNFLVIRKYYSNYYFNGGIDFTVLNKDEWYDTLLIDYLIEGGHAKSVEEINNALMCDKDSFNPQLKDFFIELALLDRDIE